MTAAVTETREEADAIVGAVAVGWDITEQRRTHAALRGTQGQFREARKMEAVGVLASGIAHDFNNLLTAIISFSELVVDMLAEDDPRNAYAQQVLEAGERAATLTGRPLAFSRKQVLQPEVLNLNSVVAEMAKLLRCVIGEDIDLVTVLAPELRLVEADPGQLEQIIMNLAVNARDAMPDGGKLTIETANVELDATYVSQHLGAVPGWHVMLAISDTGHGMDAETQARIFEPFFTTKEVGKGTGLGLSTVYGIVKQSGGYIWVDSRPGRGATFKMYLPQVDVGSVAPELAPLRAVCPQGTETVLLVEDESAVRSLVSAVLTSLGYTVLEAGHGGEALDTARRHPGSLDLLLTDMVMPEMGGREVVPAGDSLIDGDLPATLLRRLAQESTQRAPPPVQLTERERDVLRLITQGGTNTEIARSLYFSVSTVKAHVQHIIRKLGVSDRTQAAVHAIELGLLSPDDP